MSEAKLTLGRSAAQAVRRGHPWVWREAVARAPRSLKSGDAVALVDETGATLGRGLWDAASPIAARVYLRGAERIDERRLMELAERAFAGRDGVFDPGDTDAYRLCNGEGDRIPALVVDRYVDVAVLRLDGELLEPWLPRLLPGLSKALAARGVRTVARRVAADGDRARLRTLHGRDAPERITVRERGMVMEVDLHHGQKTGAFLDQRENRARVRALGARHPRVLNLFSYAGGFSVAAALGGATRVTSVDSAAAAHATAQRTFRANGLDPGAHAFVSADVFDFLARAQARGERWDLVICDPPSFAPSERAKPRALAAYRKLHAAAVGVLAEGGTLCAASCSSHVTAEDFLSTLDEQSLGGRALCLRELHGQPADHPTLPAWPEGRYLELAILG